MNNTPLHRNTTFISPFTSWWILGCLHLLAIVNNALWTFVCQFLWAPMFSFLLGTYVPRSGTAGPYGHSLLNLLRNRQTASHSDRPILQTHPQCFHLPISLNSSVRSPRVDTAKVHKDPPSITWHDEGHRADSRPASDAQRCWVLCFILCLLNLYPRHSWEGTNEYTNPDCGWLHDLFFLNSISFCKLTSANSGFQQGNLLWSFPPSIPRCDGAEPA